jgi:hypothetical protein
MNKSVSIAFVAAVCLTGCADKILSDDRIRDNTAMALHLPASAVVISDRRYDGQSATYYTARTPRRTYDCTIYGGSLMVMGMTASPICDVEARN